MRAAVLKHGRYSQIERELEALVREQSDTLRQMAATTRERFMRRIYASAAASAPSDSTACGIFSSGAASRNRLNCRALSEPRGY